MGIQKIVPSGSTSGKPIKVVATATLGTTFHTAHATNLDEVFMMLSNTSAGDVAVTVEFGGAASPDNLLKFIVPAGETILAIPGLVLTGGLVVTVFAASANVITMSGYVNRIS